MIELVEVHEQKREISVSFTDKYGNVYKPIYNYKNNPMIDTDFEKQKQQGKRELGMFERVVKKHQIPTVEVSRLERLQEGGKPEKPHWFERFLRWWYSI